MALKKNIEYMGIVANYHRIESLSFYVNSHISIIIMSYPEQEVREKEKISDNVIRFSATYETDYNENYTVSDAYNYLKTLEDFKDAEDA